MRRMDLEEKRRNEAVEKAAETAKLVAEAAAKAKTADPFSGIMSELEGKGGGQGWARKGGGVRCSGGASHSRLLRLLLCRRKG